MPKGNCALCGGVERAFCRESRGIETREGRSERPPAMRSPAAFQREIISSAERKLPALEQRVSPPRDALFVGRRALQTFERSLKSGTVSVVSRVAHNGKELFRAVSASSKCLCSIVVRFEAFDQPLHHPDQRLKRNALLHIGGFLFQRPGGDFRQKLSA